MKHYITRKSFITRALALTGAAATWGLWRIFSPADALGAAASKSGKDRAEPPMKLIYLALDGFHPAYLELDAHGNRGGRDGNCLMPRLKAFMNESVRYENARAWLPAATDMNHLNAVAGTNSGLNGIIGVWAQPTGWDSEGRPVITHSHLSMARDDKGRPVDTLFHSWKRHWPESKTLFITGKEWVGEMLRMPADQSFIDILVSARDHPSYLKAPEKESFADPHGDADAACDPESGSLGFFDLNNFTWKNFFRHFSASAIMTRLYTGQGGLLTRQMTGYPERFPHDKWIVDSTLEIFRREDPGMAYVLMAQCDDAGHCIGSAWDPDEFVDTDTPLENSEECRARDEYKKVSGRNKLLYREAALDVLRDIDVQFGRLVDGLRKEGILDRSMIILLSDHSSINHISTPDFSSTDIMGILEDASLADEESVYAFSVSSYGVLYWRDDKSKIGEAKKALLTHRALNPQTGVMECPWWVLDRRDMKEGVPGIAEKGELYHTYYVETDREKTMIWPDLIVMCRNGWQIPVYNGHVPNVGIKAPSWTPPFRVYNGGHGSVDTLPILAAIRMPGVEGRSVKRPMRIGDFALTAASVFGLELRSSTTGRDLSRDLRS